MTCAHRPEPVVLVTGEVVGHVCAVCLATVPGAGEACAGGVCSHLWAGCVPCANIGPHPACCAERGGGRPGPTLLADPEIARCGHARPLTECGRRRCRAMVTAMRRPGQPFTTLAKPAVPPKGSSGVSAGPDGRR